MYTIIHSPSDGDVSIHKMLLGTHTSGSEPNYLMIAEVITYKFDVCKWLILSEGETT
jgi:hypothetical protein